MPRRFHDAEELFPPATTLKRALAIIYDGLISIAVLLVVTWAYTMVAGWITGWDRYEQMAEAGQLSGDPGLTGGPRSEGAFGWLGFFNTVYWVDPEEQLVAIIMTQLYPNNGSQLTDKFEVLVYSTILD